MCDSDALMHMQGHNEGGRKGKKDQLVGLKWVSFALDDNSQA